MPISYPSTYFRPPPEEMSRVGGGGAADAAEIATRYRFELAGAHHELDGIEEQLGLTTGPGDHVPDRLNLLSRTIAANVVMSRRQIARIVVGSALVGFLLGLVVAAALSRRAARGMP